MILNAQQNLPDLLAETGSARLARGDDRMSESDQAARQNLDLGAFAAAFGALKCDEKAARHKM